MIVCARFPLHKLYLGLLFEDLFPAGDFIEMQHIGNVPHRVLTQNVIEFESLWCKLHHPLYDFVVRTRHPGINAAIDHLEI